MTSATPQRPVAGMLWMVTAGLCFVAVTALVKTLGARIPAAEQAFLRYLLGLVFLIPMIKPLRAAKLDARLYRIFTIRGAGHTVAVILWFYAMTRIPLSEVTAMNYLSPVYVTLGAALVLGERLAARRVLAIVVALIGVAIILRPGFREVNLGHVAMLGTAILFAVSYLSAKIVSDEVAPAVVVAMLSITVTIGLAPFAIAVWVWPTPYELAMLFAVAIFATGGHYAMTLAFKAAPVTVTQPVTFLQLIWAVLLGALVFGEPVDGFVILGGVVILAAVSFITWREAVLKRQAITPPANATKL
ncbi:DMT family transporter [Pseudaestuariivita sp.]|uniref:DMT family transporter n=1 Tax=Pseudaestuariivita sp. TaxID=2211669 RepID=UPI004059DB86